MLMHITFYIKVSFQMPIVIFDNKQRLNGISGQAHRTAGAARSKLSYLTTEHHNTIGSFHSIVAWIECYHVTAVSPSDCSKW